jgi:hypothetical protein
MVNHPNRKKEDLDYVARLRASKAEYEKEQAAQCSAQEERARLKEEEAVEAGRQWARYTATYGDLKVLVERSHHPMGLSPGTPWATHSFFAFQRGAKEVFDELRD